MVREPHAVAILACDNPEAIVLDFMQPQVAGGQLVGLCGEARRDESGRKGNATVIAFLMNPNNPNSNIEMNAAQTAANSLGKRIVVFTASSESELDVAFASIAQSRISALLGASDPFLFSRRDRLASLAARHGIPAVYYLADFARAGSLMAYGNSLTDLYRMIGVYVGRILKGEKPADLPEPKDLSTFRDPLSVSVLARRARCYQRHYVLRTHAGLACSSTVTGSLNAKVEP